MKAIFLSTALVLMAAIESRSQISIKLEEVGKHVGDSVKVCGLVSGGRYFETSQNAPTLLNIGGAFPNQLLTAVIYGENRSEFNGQPEKDWIGNEICFTGKIELYRDRPQIIIRRKSQIEIKESK